MPSAPEAPPLFSMTNCWPRLRDNRSANGRIALSVDPPGAKLTMMRTGLFGQPPVPWAVAAVASKPASKSVNRPANGRLNDT